VKLQRLPTTIRLIMLAALAALTTAMRSALEPAQRVGWWNFRRDVRRRAGLYIAAWRLQLFAALRFANAELGSVALGSKIRELREKRMTMITSARELTDRAHEENRDLTTEEEAKFNAIYGIGGDVNTEGINAEERSRRLGELGRLDLAIEREERQLEAERDAATNALQGNGNGGGAGASDPAGDRRGSVLPEAVRQWQAKRSGEFRSFLSDDDRNGKYVFELRHLNDEEQAEIRTAVAALSPVERRALQADQDIMGGYTVQPEQFVPRLLQAVDDALFIRGLATVMRLENADSLGIPSLDTDPDDADWTVELGTGNEDSAMRFGKRELKPHPLAKRIKVSKTLLRRSVLPIENIVLERLAYKTGVTEEKAFLTGSGALQPLGVFTASADGVPTSRDVSTGNTTTSIAADGLIEAKYFLKAQYWPRAVWMFHRDAVKQIAKLKDGDGQYIWQPGLQAGQPDRLLSFPMRVSEFAPNTFTTGLYVGILGDFAQYWIADALSMELQRLVELYAETNQTGFILRKETDGMPVLSEAFVRVKLA